MISLAELATGLEGATLVGSHQVECPCPRCGSKATIRDFGARRSFRCEQCGTLEEGEFLPTNKGPSADPVPTAAQVLDTASGNAQLAQPKRQGGDAQDDGAGKGQLAGDATRYAGYRNRPVEVAAPADRVDTQQAHSQQDQPDRSGAAVGVHQGTAGGHPEAPQRNGAVRQVPLSQNGARRVVSVAPRYAADDILKRVLPQDLEAEQSVLGAILLDNEAIAKIGWLSAESFYREAHREIYRAFLSLRSTGDPIDAVTLAAVLRARGHFEFVGGADYIAELATTVPTALNIEAYAAIVRDKAINREVIVRATKVVSLGYDGVTGDALLGEMERLLKPIAESNSPDLPALITRDIEVVSARDFYGRNSAVKARQWLVDAMLAKKEISLWSGKVEHGKTTLLRTLCMCLLRGEFFLERHTYPSRILYVMLDADGEDLTYEEFTKLGLNWQEDPIDFLVDPVMAIRPRSFEQFHGKLLELKPDFVIIDPLGRFEKMEPGQVLDYSMTYVMARFSELAKQTNCHIALLHHIPRGRNDAEDPATAGFGSIAIAGGCNARFSCIKKAGGIYTVRSSQGKGGGFAPFEAEMVLDRDEMTHWVTLRGPYDWKAQAQVIEPAVREAVNASDEWLGANDLGKIVGVQRSIAGAAAKSLERRGLIQMKVTKANKHLFARLERQADFDDSKAN